MSLAVLVVSYNSRATLPALLASVRGADEVVVVDNASTDGTDGWLRARAGQHRLFLSPTNLGFSRAINLAASLSRADTLLLLNPDAALLPTGPPGIAALAPLLARLARTQGAWAVGLGQVDAQGHPQLAFGPAPTLLGEVARRTLQRRLDVPGSLGARAAARALGWAVPGPRRVAWVAGSSLLVARQHFLRVGGFDPHFFLYFEDIDFCLRLRAAGGQVVFDPTVRVLHHRGRSMAQAAQTARRAYRHSQARFARLHWPGPVGLGVQAYARLRGAVRP